MEKRIITISREFGSGGRTIGKLVAEHLGIRCYDAELIQKLAAESGFDENYVKEAGEYTPGGFLFQVSLRVTVQNQVRIAQRIIVDEVIQFRPLCHSHIQCILNPGTVNGNFSPIPEQQFHAAGIHVDFTGSFIVLHVCVLSAFTALSQWSVVLSYDKV